MLEILNYGLHYCFITYVINFKINWFYLMNPYFNILLDPWEQYVAMETRVCLIISTLFFAQEFQCNVILSAMIKLAIIHLKLASTRSKQTRSTNDSLSSLKLSLNYGAIVKSSITHAQIGSLKMRNQQTNLAMVGHDTASVSTCQHIHRLFCYPP